MRGVSIKHPVTQEVGMWFCSDCRTLVPPAQLKGWRHYLCRQRVSWVSGAEIVWVVSHKGNTSPVKLKYHLVIDLRKPFSRTRNEVDILCGHKMPHMQEYVPHLDFADPDAVEASQICKACLSLLMPTKGKKERWRARAKLRKGHTYKCHYMPAVPGEVGSSHCNITFRYGGDYTRIPCWPYHTRPGKTYFTHQCCSSPSLEKHAATGVH